MEIAVLALPLPVWADLEKSHMLPGPQIPQGQTEEAGPSSSKIPWIHNLINELHQTPSFFVFPLKETSILLLLFLKFYAELAADNSFEVSILF